MSTGYQITDPTAAHFVTFTIVDWVDLFTRKSYRDVLLDNLNFYHEQRGLRTYCYVVMSNHMHLILEQPEGNLSHTIRDYKKFTSRTMADMVATQPESRRDWITDRFEYNARLRANVSGRQVWTHDNHAVELWSRKFYQQKEHYTHMNPVRAGLVEKPEDWIYSSAYDRLQVKPRVTLYEWV